MMTQNGKILSLVVSLLLASNLVGLAYENMFWRNSADINEAWSLPKVRTTDTSITPPSFSVQNYGGTSFELVAVADFDRNGSADLLWRNPGNGNNVIWFMNGITVTSTPQIETGDPAYKVVGTGDFNGDGYPDILWRSAAADITAIWYMKGTNHIQGYTFPPPYGAPPDWSASLVGDFNNDGWPDIYWQNDTSRISAFWYLNASNVVKTIQLPTYPGPSNWVGAAVAHLNMIGNSDLVFRHTTGLTAAWLMRETNDIRNLTLTTRTYPNWKIGGTGNYYSDTGRAFSAIIENTNLVLWWRLERNSKPDLYRRQVGSTNWGTAIVTNSVAPRYTNFQAVGSRFEYKLTDDSVSELLVSAIKAPPTHFRGKAIMVVANYLTNALAADLETFRNNLVADGWTVVRTNVPSHNDVTWASNVTAISSIRDFIVQTYNASAVTNLPRAVILIGHVPIPMSGWHNPDAHGERCLPADGFYGDIDGIFTDSWRNQTCVSDGTCPCEYDRHNNIPGDGKFDLNKWPTNQFGISALELMVGRIDFSRQPAFTNPTYVAIALNETNLMRQYLNKTDRYRRKQNPSIPERVVTGSWINTAEYNSDIMHYGVRTASKLFGTAPDQLIEGDGVRPENGSIWSVQGGAGTLYHMQGATNLAHSTLEGDGSDVSILRPANQPHGAFYSLFGSCFHDFAYSDNFMRGLTAVDTNYNFGTMWYQAFKAGANEPTPLHLQRVALGEEAGTGLLETVNQTSEDTTFINWIGDPTLRVKLVAPVTNLGASTNSNGVTLTWTASVDPTATQHFIYRSVNQLDGPFVLLTSSPVSGTSWLDSGAPFTNITYLVRAAGLTTTASGSFTNLSQGTFRSIVR